MSSPDLDILQAAYMIQSCTIRNVEEAGQGELGMMFYKQRGSSGTNERANHTSIYGTVASHEHDRSTTSGDRSHVEVSSDRVTVYMQRLICTWFVLMSIRRKQYD